MSIKLKLDGFEELLRAIEKANGSAEQAATRAMEKSAEIMQSELKAQMQAADKKNTMSRLISRMPDYEVQNEHGVITARVGYIKGEYNPKNLSDAYKVIILNYGTPRKKKKNGSLWIEPRGFINEAKKKGKPKIQQVQKSTLDEILRGLKK